jgi:hypothetical protein
MHPDGDRRDDRNCSKAKAEGSIKNVLHDRNSEDR